MKYAVDKLGASENEVLFVCPSDHIITPEKEFKDCLQRSEALAKQGHIVTFGIRPDRPETGYGYIKQSKKSVGDGASMVESFVEKPKLKKAQEYLKSGDYFWNSGMFAFQIGTFLEELQNNAPDIHDKLEGTYEEVCARFEEMPDISIDYAVMEKSKRVVVMPLDITWSDIGSWDNVYDYLEKDAHGNATTGRVVARDTKNCLILGNKRLVATIGMEDTLIVETDDVILIAKKGESQKVKELVEELKLQGSKEINEHVTTYRPWGSYTVLEEGERYKIKRIVVNPQQRLSLQMHYHRSEHWVVVTGTAKVTNGDEEVFVHENESIYVPKGSKHRVENPGKVRLEIIEVQVGEYLGEDDDIVFA